MDTKGTLKTKTRVSTRLEVGYRMLLDCFGSVPGGETGIRTPVRFDPKHAFQACDLNHSSISPLGRGL